MGMRQFLSSIIRIMLLAAVAVLPHALFAGTEQIIYSFAGDADGEYVDSDLVIDRAGNIYGTSVQGGAFGTGTVFQLTPSAAGWIHTVLYSFTGGADGGQPYKGVVLDGQGNLYGTAVVGGTGGSCVEAGCGVVYKLSNSGGVWTETVIYNFTGGNDGYGPGAPLVFDKAGNLYGTTPTGGARAQGVVFQLRPVSGTWKFKLLHTFTGGADGGGGSAGRLLPDNLGNIYGVATVGGAYGSGTAYRLSQGTNGSWTFKTLYAFKGQPDAGFPYGGLVRDQSGNLYGTTYYDGANDLGSVYVLHPMPGDVWKEKVLHSFSAGSGGNSSIATLVFDDAGNLYGTTSEGGAGCSCGTIFKLTKGSNGQWTESTAYRFQGQPDAGFAYNGMARDAAGNLYGATVHGGTTDDGVIYHFIP